MKSYLQVLLVSGFLLGTDVMAEPLSMAGSDSIQSILSGQQGKRVSLKLSSGELTGKVNEVNGEIVHLMELSGKEFYDAVVVIKDIEAVVIRARDK